MNELYSAVGISKQGFHQWMDHYMEVLEEQQQLLPILHQIRADHPRMSAREMYRLISPVTMGRDLFESFCFAQGFKIAKQKVYHRTTNSLGVTRFENRTLGKELTGVNQIWVSDITYYRIMDRFYYLTFIMDLFSRYIVGYSAAHTLLTLHTTIPALRMAIQKRQPPTGLIIHSDGGGQYYSKEFLAITRNEAMTNSMCECVYENAHAERINGTIKNDYLYPYNPQDFDELTYSLRKAIKMYNQYRPHKSLSSLSPYQFEKKYQS